jgi:flagellar protein FlbD
MITLTRLTGAAFALNPDLIERIDSTKYLVREDLHEVVAAVLDYRAEVLATASAFEQAEGGLHRRGRLSAVREAEGPVVPISPRQA